MENKENQYKENSKTTEAEISCNSCGTHLKFKPGVEALVCPNCKAENEISTEKAEIKENDYLSIINNLEKKSEHQEVHTVSCNSCGGSTTLKENEVAASCPYCGGSLIVAQQETHNALKPEYVLPFKIEDKEAFTLFKNWINSLWWAPNKLKKLAKQVEKLVGVYYPYWSYDSNTISKYSGQRGDEYTVEESYDTTDDDGDTTSSTRTVTHINWYFVSGIVNNTFDDVLVVASDSLPREYVRKLAPWDMENLQEYNDKFLSGFRAETYFADVKEGFGIAKEHMGKDIRSNVESDIGGDHQRIHQLDVTYNDIKFKHILLPIWISAYKYNEKIYRFVVNGRTGEVQGDRPYSWIKITLASLVVASIIGGIIYYFYNN